MATPRTPREDLQRRNAGLPPQQAANPTPSSDRAQQLHPRGVAGDTLDSGMNRRQADATQSRKPAATMEFDDDDLQAPDFGNHGGR